MLTPFNQIAECRYGKMLYNVNDSYIGRSMEVYGEYSDGEVQIFRHLVRAGDVVVEGGSNIGAHTVPLAQLAGETGMVLAFEPQRLVFQTLCANIALNSLTNVWPAQAALGATEGILRAHHFDPRVKNNFGGMSLSIPGTGEEAAVIPLDEVAPTRCRLIKLDVEGMELEALRGASEVIRRFRPILYLEADWPGKSDALIAHIRSLDYRMFWHEPFMFSPLNFRGNQTNLFDRIVSRNLLCVPSEMPDV